MHCQNILLVPSHYLTKEQRDSNTIEIVDRVWVKHSQRGKHWVKHSHIHKARRIGRKHKRQIRGEMVDPAMGEEDQWKQLFNEEMPTHIRQSIAVIEEEIFSEFKVKLGEGVVMSHY